MASQEEISYAFLFREHFRDHDDSDQDHTRLSTHHEIQFSLQLLGLLSDISFESDPTMKESLGFLKGKLSAAASTEVLEPTLPISDLTILSRALPDIMKVAKDAGGFAEGTLSEAEGEASWNALEQAIHGIVPPPPPSSSGQGETLKAGWREATHYIYFRNLNELFIPNFETVMEIMGTFGNDETHEYEIALRTEARKWSWSFGERTAEEEEKDALEEGDAISSLANNKVFDEDYDGVVSGGEHITILIDHTEEPAAMSDDEMD